MKNTVVNKHKNAKKILIIQTAVGDYRDNFFLLLKARKDVIVNLFAGKRYFCNGYRTRCNTITITFIDNIFLFRENLLYQKGVISRCISYDIVILEFNPRIISSWIILLIRRLLGRRTALWGHAWSRKGKQSRFRQLRALMRDMSNVIIVYSEQQRKELQLEAKPGIKIVAAPNSIYRKSDINPLTPNIATDRLNDYIYVGSLKEEKDVLFFIKSYEKLYSILGTPIRFIIIGDGPLMGKIKKYILTQNLKDKILLCGHISDRTLLEKYYRNAIASVIPGTGGLSITQSLGYGVPVIIANKAKHGPEVEALSIYNSRKFETGNIDSLVSCLTNMYNEKSLFIKHREDISREIRDNYSAENMIEGFSNVWN